MMDLTPNDPTHPQYQIIMIKINPFKMYSKLKEKQRKDKEKHQHIT